MKNFRWSSLRARLIYLVILSALPLLIAIIYNGIKFQKDIETQLQDNATKISLLATNVCEEAIEGTYHFLVVLSFYPEIISNDYGRCNRLLSSILKKHHAYLNIGVCNINGDVICSAFPITAPVNASHKSYFKRTLETRDFSMGNYQIEAITKEQSVDFGYPLFKADKSLHRIVFATLSLDWLDSILQKIPLPNGAFAVVSDIEGQILGSYPNAAQWAGKTIPKKLLIYNAKDTVTKLMNAKWIDNTNILYTVKPIEITKRVETKPIGDNEAISAYLIIGIPKDILLNEANKNLKRNLLIFLIAILIAIIASSIIAEKFVIYPINSLINTTKLLTKGYFSARTIFAQDKSEFGELSKTFNTMAYSIEEYAKNLEATKQALETALKEHETVNEHLKISLLEQTKTKEALQKTEEQFRQAQKMEAIGRLAGGIAHDFNNILTVIIGHTELLQGGIKDQSMLKESLAEIYNASNRATVLVRQLLAFSRKQVLEPKIIDLNTVINGIGKMLKHLIGENILLNILLQPNLAPVKADPGQIEQVLLNLAVNSRDAMPDGGILTIETANITLDETYLDKHFDIQPGKYVLLAVSDNGCGMSKDVLSHLFEPFFTTKEKGKGTGLGLSTVYGIIKQSDGHILVYSEEGHGTTFKIYLPMTDESPKYATISNKPKVFTGRKETILLVEDEEGVRSLIREILHQHGYTVLQAANGDEALKIVASFEGTIHLLLTDMILFGISGMEISNRVITLRPNIKTLYISGYTDNAITSQNGLKPGTHFLQKPFTAASLVNKIREVLGS